MSTGSAQRLEAVRVQVGRGNQGCLFRVLLTFVERMTIYSAHPDIFLGCLKNSRDSCRMLERAMGGILSSFRERVAIAVEGVSVVAASGWHEQVSPTI